VARAAKRHTAAVTERQNGLNRFIGIWKIICNDQFPSVLRYPNQ
jgi:hypothetical protein